MDTYKTLSKFYFSKVINRYIKKKYPHVLIYGNFGAMNIGDEAILAGQIRELQKIKGIKIHVACRYESQIEQYHREVCAISLFHIHKIIQILIFSDFILFGGGGLIAKADDGIKSYFYQVYSIGLFLFLPFLLRKPVFVVGLGIYDNANLVLLKVTLFFLRKTKVVAVRDSHSYDLLRSHNVKCSLYRDNSFLMNLLSKDQIKKYSFFKKELKKNRYNIGLSLRKPYKKSEEALLVKMISRLVNTYTPQIHFWLYALDFQDRYDNDKKFIEKIMNQINHNSKKSIHIVPITLTPKEMFSSFHLMDAIIGMRLHSLIFAYRMKIPFFGISYDKKCSSFLTSVNRRSSEIKSGTHQKLSNFILSTIRESVLNIPPIKNPETKKYLSRFYSV